MSGKNLKTSTYCCLILATCPRLDWWAGNWAKQIHAHTNVYLGTGTGAKLVRQVARSKQQHNTWITFYENNKISYWPGPLKALVGARTCRLEPTSLPHRSFRAGPEGPWTPRDGAPTKWSPDQWGRWLPFGVSVWIPPGALPSIAHHHWNEDGIALVILRHYRPGIFFTLSKKLKKKKN